MVDDLNPEPRERAKSVGMAESLNRPIGAPKPRERAMSMDVAHSLKLPVRGSATRKSDGQILGLSPPLPTLFEYIRRNSNIYVEGISSSQTSSTEELNSGDEFEDELAKFNRNRRKSSIQNVTLPVPHVPQVPNSQPSLLKSQKATLPKVAAVPSFTGKTFNLFHLFQVPNRDFPDSSLGNKTVLPVDVKPVQQQTTSQVVHTTPSHNVPSHTHQTINTEHNHNVPSTQPSHNVARKPAKISKREMNFSSPVSF